MSEHRGCELPEDLYYDLDYVWVRPEEDGTYTIGLTDPSQTMSGKVQYVWIKDVGTHREWKKPMARLESGKWAGGIPAPFPRRDRGAQRDGTGQPQPDQYRSLPRRLAGANEAGRPEYRFDPSHHR